MRKKYTIRKKRKTISTMYIFIILLVLLLSTSVGYSLFSSNFNIIGKIQLGENYAELPTELSNSELKVHVGSSWEQEGFYVFNINLKLINLDENLTSWVVTVDFPHGVSIEKSQFWCAADVEVLILEDCTRLIFTNYDWNGDKKLNEEIDFGFNIAFAENVQMQVENVTFNRRLVQNVEYTGNAALYLVNINTN